jgi:lipopolysaccharide export LptBFGC system permease protein LptF
MESRTAFRGAGISKWVVALCAVIVVLCLGVMAAYLAKGVSAPAATHTSIVSTQAAPTTAGKDEPAYSFDPSNYSPIP